MIRESVAELCSAGSVELIQKVGSSSTKIWSTLLILPSQLIHTLDSTNLKDVGAMVNETVRFVESLRRENR